MIEDIAVSADRNIKLPTEGGMSLDSRAHMLFADVG